jgi:L-arabinonolactonase
MQVGFVGDHRTRLGESPLWDWTTGRLRWVDIVANRIFSARPDGSDLVVWDYDQTVGSIGLKEGGGLIAALADGFYAIDNNSGGATPIFLPPPSGFPLRFNDGKADRFGRFLSGTMQGHDLTACNSALWQLDTNGVARCIEGPVGVSNSICFSPDGGTLYFADSIEGKIRRYAYDGATGDISARDDFIDCAAYGSGSDGATVDSEGRLWVALIVAHTIACFAPDGTLIDRFETPVPNPSCPAFGGDDLATLFVTTISNSGHRMVSDHPDAGRIMAISGLGATGLPEGKVRIENHIDE